MIKRCLSGLPCQCMFGWVLRLMAAGVDDGDGQWRERVGHFIALSKEGKVDEVNDMIHDEEDHQGLIVAYDEEGMTALMAAAAMGSTPCVLLLLEYGAVWNAQDKYGKNAGEYAIDNEHYDLANLLLEHAVRCELLLSTIERKEIEERRMNDSEGKSDADVRNEAYLKGDVQYINGEDGDDRLIDENCDGVMMAWETPIMEMHASQMLKPFMRTVNADTEDTQCEASVLNIGYGMGIIDAAFHRRKPKRHTIIEAHPKVIQRITDDGFIDGSDGIRILCGRWQELIDKLNEKYDAIFFDTYGEYYEDMRQFHNFLPSLLKPGGIYSFFNGLAPDNIFFQAVYARIIELELSKIGINSEFLRLDINRPEGDAWRGVKRKYFYNDVYYLPLCTKVAE